MSHSVDFSLSISCLFSYTIPSLNSAWRRSHTNFQHYTIILIVSCLIPNAAFTINMQYSLAILLAAFAATNVFAHGVIDSVTGANGVSMPALSGKHSTTH